MKYIKKFESIESKKILRNISKKIIYWMNKNNLIEINLENSNIIESDQYNSYKIHSIIYTSNKYKNQYYNSTIPTWQITVYRKSGDRSFYEDFLSGFGITDLENDTITKILNYLKSLTPEQIEEERAKQEGRKFGL